MRIGPGARKALWAMSRLHATFADLSGRRPALVPFLMAGDPDAGACAALLDALPGAGADIVELGMPFADPMADGPAIQAAGQRALAAGAHMGQTLELARGFRARHADTPLVLMGYTNPVLRYGPDRFARDAAAAGADGLILVDLPPEESGAVDAAARAAGLDMIRLVAPTTPDARLPLILERAGGFVYYVSITGITGAAAADARAVAPHLARIRAATDLPIAVGFGVKTPDDARAMAQAGADAVVVGSALVTAAHEKGPDAAVHLVRALSGALSG